MLRTIRKSACNFVVFGRQTKAEQLEYKVIKIIGEHQY